MKNRVLMGSGNIARLLMLVLVLVHVLGAVSCGPEKSHDRESGPVSAKEARRQETAQMVAELAALVTNGDPEDYCHWNSKMAEVLKSRLGNGTPQQQADTWFNYCTQLLLSGQSAACIAELERKIVGLGKPLQQSLNENTEALFALLAIAYLRLGEQQNCQQNHTPESCIVPLREGGVYKLQDGPKKAAVIYNLLLTKFRNPRYGWLLSLAFMTMGQYPHGVPRPHRLPFPNWKLEQNDFPPFKEVAMSVGLAVNGLSGGTCIDDFNNDGHLDVFMTSYGMSDNVRLFLSDQKGGYKETTEAAGLMGIVSGLNCIHADYDNDGAKDILVLRGAWLGAGGSHPNSLLKNMGDGTFTDVTRSSGLLSYHPTQNAAWGDYNRDGYLDLFIGNESSGAAIHRSELFRNNGDGTFTEVAASSGLGTITAFVKGSAFGDINNDGWPELYVSVMGGKNLLFRNDKGTFREMGGKAGVADHMFSFPCWFWDVNNDGLDDLFVGSYDARYQKDAAGDFAKELLGVKLASEKPALYINQGDETFREASKDYGIDRTMYAMGANFGDLDNDGFLDFYVGTGAPDFTTVVPNRMFRNVDGKRFEEVTTAGRFGHIQKGHGVAFADLDRDGDQDIFAVMGGAMEGDTFTNILFENPISKNNWIVLELEGVTSNRAAIGTLVELELNTGRRIFARVNSGGSFGASSLQQEIGLGKASAIKKLTVHWQNGPAQTFEDIKIKQLLRIKEGAAKPEILPYTPTPFRKMAGNHMHHHAHNRMASEHGAKGKTSLHDK